MPIYALEDSTDKPPYYVMRFIQGNTFGQAIKKYHAAPTPLAFRSLLHSFVGVCQTMAYAHSKGVVHRDLKPQNVMLGPFGETLIVDWGLAKNLEDEIEDASTPAEAGSVVETGDNAAALTRVGQMLGTPSYMALEQASGRTESIDRRTDVYALGAILYEVLVGGPPYVGTTTEEIVAMILAGPPTYPRTANASAPRALDAVCRKAMARSPDERYSAAGELAEDVERYLADEPVSEHGEPWVNRMSRWARKHRTVVASGVLAVTLATIFLAIIAGVVSLKNAQLDGKNDELDGKNSQLSEALILESTSRRRAREALDSQTTFYLDLVSRQSKLTETDRQYLNQALATYPAFAEETGDDEQTQAAVAAAYDRVGDIQVKLGQRADATLALRQAVDRYKALRDHSPTNRSYARQWAVSLSNLGNALSTLR